MAISAQVDKVASPYRVTSELGMLTNNKLQDLILCQEQEQLAACPGGQHDAVVVGFQRKSNRLEGLRPRWIGKIAMGTQSSMTM